MFKNLSERITEWLFENGAVPKEDKIEALPEDIMRRQRYAVTFSQL